MPRSPFEEWLKMLEYRKNRSIFVVEWLAMFTIAWLFWSVMFFGAPGSVRPALAAATMAFLYATCIVYDRLYRATGCRMCSSPLPLLRQEVGRRHLPDEEHCMDVQYGGEEYGEQVIDVYRKVTRADMVIYCCRPATTAGRRGWSCPARAISFSAAGIGTRGDDPTGRRTPPRLAG